MKQGWTARRPFESIGAELREPRTMNVFHVSGSLATVVVHCSQSVNKLHYIWNLFLYDWTSDGTVTSAFIL